MGRLACVLAVGFAVGLFFGLWGGCALCRRDPLEHLGEEERAALVGVLQLLSTAAPNTRREL